MSQKDIEAEVLKAKIPSAIKLKEDQKLPDDIEDPAAYRSVGRRGQIWGMVDSRLIMSPTQKVQCCAYDKSIDSLDHSPNEDENAGSLHKLIIGPLHFDPIIVIWMSLYIISNDFYHKE